MLEQDRLAQRLSPGDPAPDCIVHGPDGAPLELGQLWASGPAVLVFLRHFG